MFIFATNTNVFLLMSSFTSLPVRPSWGCCRLCYECCQSCFQYRSRPQRTRWSSSAFLCGQVTSCFLCLTGFRELFGTCTKPCRHRCRNSVHMFQRSKFSRASEFTYKFLTFGCESKTAQLGERVHDCSCDEIIISLLVMFRGTDSQPCDNIRGSIVLE